MCLILVAWRAHPDFPLVVAANRDEFFKRRTASADFWLRPPASAGFTSAAQTSASAEASLWSDHPRVLAGRDLEAGGTWLGMARGGPGGYKFAALTNFRDPANHKPDAPSRGRLVADFLTGDASIDAYLGALNPADYNGFNLLLGDGKQLIAFSNVSLQRHELAPGVYGLSNHLLDTPWPKVGAGKTALSAALTALPDEKRLFRLLRDDTIHPDDALPATGVSLEWERLLSAAFIHGHDYGTRCSTVIKVGIDGVATFDEQTWLVGGAAGERRRYRFRSADSRSSRMPTRG
ncbi:MAG: NRDE family protein [Rhodocyclaceae bacterium]|nr:NRDE family protein [Rhodocyclaceae bacterium]